MFGIYVKCINSDKFLLTGKTGTEGAERTAGGQRRSGELTLLLVTFIIIIIIYYNIKNAIFTVNYVFIQSEACMC